MDRLHDPVVTVSFTLTNNGTRAGTEVRYFREMHWCVRLTAWMADPPTVPEPTCIRQVCAAEPEGVRQRLPRGGREQDGDPQLVTVRLLGMGRGVAELADTSWGDGDLCGRQQQGLAPEGKHHELSECCRIEWNRSNNQMLLLTDGP